MVLSAEGYSQNKVENKVNAIGVSGPVIWNNSNGVYYSLGNRREPSGNAISYGANIHYSHFFYKNLFFIGGIGYYKQRFKIQRPFNYNSPFEPIFQTQSYSYDNIHLTGGLGFQKQLKDGLYLNIVATYNSLNSFREKYVLNKEYGTEQINKKSIPVGHSINIGSGLEKMISKKVSIGFDLVLPVYSKWNNDGIFYKYNRSDDEQQVARTRFALGANISCYYQFKNSRL